MFDLPDYQMDDKLTIRFLRAHKFIVFNVDKEKRPIDKNKRLMASWQSISPEEVRKHHDEDCPRWGMKVGIHSDEWSRAHPGQGWPRHIMVLDFDCCGSKDKDGKRQGCEYTRQKLKEYMDFGILDGMFSSSTAGNYNVLIEYSSCSRLKQLFELLSSKGRYCKENTNLEIFYGSNRQVVIPPTATISKITNELGAPRKFLNNKPLFLIEENMPIFEFILSLLPSSKEECNKKRPYSQPAITSNHISKTPRLPAITDNIQSHDQVPSESPVAQDEILDLLFNVIKNERNTDGLAIITKTEWFQICGALKSNGYPMEVFIKYSEPISNPANNTAQKFWEGLKKLTMSIDICH
ncbi:MAG: hypothetical protein EOO46_22735 [Flavobacterium sp.]|nr:MAG: hypothetical protein EOO46_22735 [Flavobacterium sp.]